MVIGPLVGAFAGVFLGFRKNSKHQDMVNHEKKLLLLKILRHEVKKSIDLLQDPLGYLIPIDAWNSIVYSGNIVLFEHPLSTKLGDIYFTIQNYNYEAKRTRDASEHFHSLAEPYPHVNGPDYLDHKNWTVAKERWEILSKDLEETTEKLRCMLIDLEKDERFNEGINDPIK